MPRTSPICAAAAVTAALLTSPVSAQTPAAHRSAAALMKVEHQWLAAIVHHDVAALARILGSEFIDSDFQGDAITRAQYLAYFAKPVPPAAPRLQQRFEDTKVRFLVGGDVAIVTGVVTTWPAVASQSSSSPDGIRHSRFTDVFVWRDARWQAVTGQETHFTPRAR
jgi:ketosteroid isomerase-like protein